MDRDEQRERFCERLELHAAAHETDRDGLGDQQYIRAQAIIDLGVPLDLLSLDDEKRLITALSRKRLAGHVRELLE